MSGYSTLHRIRHLRGNEGAAQISDVARLANELQQAEGLGRTQALAEAERLQTAHGMGLTVSYSPARE